ncbi:MAG: hypothetical protein CVU13_04495 [Bacteroidetes bacterium HGW-Bacteroidetes-8]|nr:MAG: hypothetical protein CVU13_04495 [Bacteroidetes bacterium HGW-Bacteroidetes-8]
MKFRKSITVLVILVAIFVSLASISGIFSKGGPGNYDYTSIRGEKVTLYGIGLYRHMSADVAIQGIAQDYVTLFIGVPLLLISFFWAMKGSLKGRFMLAGVLNYLFITYLFYMNMAMYNQLFLLYIALTGTTFFAFVLSLLSIDIQKLPEQFNEKAPVKFSGIFLIVNAVIIALLWLSIIVPPLIDNTIYPDSVDHFTTLTVQGFDLSLLLPISFLGGLLLLKRSRFGYFISTVTLIFLSILMTALVAKIIAMANAGVNVIPAIFIIPAINLVSIICSVKMLKSINIR